MVISLLRCVWQHSGGNCAAKTRSATLESANEALQAMLEFAHSCKYAFKSMTLHEQLKMSVTSVFKVETVHRWVNATISPLQTLSTFWHCLAQVRTEAHDCIVCMASISCRHVKRTLAFAT